MENNWDATRYTIPSFITQENIVDAIHEIQIKRWDPINNSKKYDLCIDGDRLPPKVVLSIANRFATGKKIPVSEFHGGEIAANKFLRKLGFDIVEKGEGCPENVSQSHSWKILSDRIAMKKTDKSVFIHKTTGLPKGKVREFFSVRGMKPGERKKIILWIDSIRFEATLEWLSYDSQRTRLVWDNDIASVIRKKFPKCYTFFQREEEKSENSPLLKFVKGAKPDEYDVELIDTPISENEENSEIILEKYREYSRREVHDIFDKNSPFTLKSGTWGIRGIVSPLSNRDDFIFFVTFGRSDLGFTFEESVTESGILTWQSEPKQKLRDSTIQKLIRHDHQKNTVHLFLRTHRDRKFSYLGRLAYLSHNNEREEPVLFKWQILDWDLDDNQAEAMGLELIPDNPSDDPLRMLSDSLVETPPPEQQSPISFVGQKSTEFVAKKVDFAENEEKRKEIGKAGELLVLKREKKLICDNGHQDLLSEIDHVSEVQGDGAGYDIKSISPSGERKYIEVKTTVGGMNTPFVLSINELNFLQAHSERYYLYRIYEFDRKTNTGKFFVLRGDISKQIVLEPIRFNCRPQMKKRQTDYSTLE
jgi:hypothetical protein